MFDRGAALAPGTDATFQEMQERRPQALRRGSRFRARHPRGTGSQHVSGESGKCTSRSSSGLGGWTYEHLKGMLDNTDTFELLLSACNSPSQAKVPREIADALMGARLTALTKTGWRCERHRYRDVLRQLVKVFEAECSPFQYALSHTGGDRLRGSCCGAATDANPTTTILSVDGIGAYDHVHRAAMLGRLARMPAARALLPFVRLSYGRLSTQAEGGEQGEPLMPLLFSIGIQGALEEVATHLVDGEQLCAFLCSRCIEDGGEDCEGKIVLGGIPTVTDLQCAWQNPLTKRPPTSESLNANIAAHFVRRVLPRTR